MQDSIVKVRTRVTYGRKFNYPENRNAELFCKLLERKGMGGQPCKSLTDWQLDIVRELGFEVESTTEIVRRNRAKRAE